MMTLQEVKEALCHYDEVTLLEVLDIKSDELVERFEDIIEAQYERLIEELGYDKEDISDDD